MPKILAKAPTGYWFFLCNPKLWAIDAYLETRPETFFYKITAFHQPYLKAGDKALIRVGKDGRTQLQRDGQRKLEAGIYAIVELLAEPEALTETLSQAHDLPAPPTTGRDILVVRLQMLNNLVDRPIPLSQLRHEANIDTDLINGVMASSYPLEPATYDRVLTLATETSQRY